MTAFQYEIYQDPQESVLRIRVTGMLTREGIAGMVQNARQQAGRNRLNLLYDMRAMELPAGLRLSEILSFVMTHKSLSHKPTDSARSASLITKQLLKEEVWELYSYATRNAGLEWQFFIRESDALAWLKGC